MISKSLEYSHSSGVKSYILLFLLSQLFTGWDCSPKEHLPNRKKALG